MKPFDDHCACASCGTMFVSTDAFDAHRVGDHDYLVSPEHPEGRRCLGAEEMEQAGFRLSAAGRWTLRQTAQAS